MRILVSTEPADQVGVTMLRGIPGIEVVLYDPDRSSEAAHGDVLIPPYHRSRRAIAMLDHQPGLRHVQLLSAGADRWQPVVPPGVTLATAAGAHAGAVSEWIISALLALLRRWPTLVRYQAASTWAHNLVQSDTLAGRRVLVLGAGSIASATATKLAAFDATATLVGRTARPGVHASGDLLALVPQHDTLVIAAPLTDQTRGLIDRHALAALPDHSLVVNAGRGPIIDTAALIDELGTGRVQAALDVTDPEPLPSDHPLWQLDGALISPHLARATPGGAVASYRVASARLGRLAMDYHDHRLH